MTDNPPQPCGVCGVSLASCDALRLYRATPCCPSCAHDDETR